MALSMCLLINLPPVIDQYVMDRMYHKGYASPSDKVDAYNQVIADVARSHHIELVDLHQLVMQHPGADTTAASSCIGNVANGSYPDGVHLRSECYKLLADKIHQVLRQAGYSAHSIIALGDSLTVGLGQPHGYPYYLAKLLGYDLEKRYHPFLKALKKQCQKQPQKKVCRRLDNAYAGAKAVNRFNHEWQ